MRYKNYFLMSLLIAISFCLYSNITSASGNKSENTEGLIEETNNVKITIDSENHPNFKDAKRRCTYYWPYYRNKVINQDGEILSKSECRRNSDLISLSKGYAPLGVFFRSVINGNKTEVRNYHWEIHKAKPNKEKSLLASYDSFNASMIFENPGKYIIELIVTFNDETQAKDSTTVSVWPRDGRIFYVDSVKGDDRYNGLSTSPDPECNPETESIGECNGPWRSATRGFSVLAPRKWLTKNTKYYGKDSVCNSYVNNTLFLHSQEYYSTQSKSSVRSSEALKDKKGNYLKINNAHICTDLAKSRKSTLRPGDQVLFKRGQTYNLETGIFTVKRSNLNDPDHRYTCTPLIFNPHWSYPLGIHFGAFGNGKRPLIKNTGETNCFLFNFDGVGLFHLSFQDLEFDMENPEIPPTANRVSFMYGIEHPINIVYDRVKLNRYKTGLVFNNAHGMFINNSEFFDSTAAVLYSQTALDVALTNNRFDYSGNHIAYTNMSNGLITGNTFNRHAFGRTALRVFGSKRDFLTESIWISDNIFEGWIDPRTPDKCIDPSRCHQFTGGGGKRYNWSLVELQPNVHDEERFLEKIVFKRNILRNAETLLGIGAAHDVLVENNLFDTTDYYGSSRIKLNSVFAKRPLKNVKIINNTFVEHQKSKENKNSIIDLVITDHMKENHNNIGIINNRFLNIQNDCVLGTFYPRKQTRKCLNNTSYLLTQENKRLFPYIIFDKNVVKKQMSGKQINKVIQSYDFN